MSADYECDCCGYPFPVGDLKEHKNPGQEPRRLCQCCANTCAGMATAYPDQQPPGLVQTLKALCWLANRLRDDVREAAERRAEG